MKGNCVDDIPWLYIYKYVTNYRIIVESPDILKLY